MGSMHAAEYAAADVPLEAQLTMQLRSNIYPPAPHEMVSVAVEAIKRWNSDNYTRIRLPEGIRYRGRRLVAPIEVIEVYRLGAWLKHDDYCECEECVGEGDCYDYDGGL